MSPLAGYQELRVWQEAIDLAEAVHWFALAMPSRERFALANQMERAAVSVPSNVAEGHQRNYKNDFIRFIAIAQGSLAELETQLILATRFGYGSEAQRTEIAGRIRAVAGMLNRLRSSLDRPDPPGPKHLKADN